MTRPVVALDVDGVVVLDEPAAVPARQWSVSAFGRWRREILVPEVAPELLRELAADAEVVWASSWAHLAHPLLAEALELPADPWPFLGVQFGKTAAVASYAAGRPWALIDESVEPSSGAGGVLVRVEATRGLADVVPADLLGALARPHP